MGKYYYIYWHLTDMKSLTGGVFLLPAMATPKPAILPRPSFSR
jgi:hypothetical protein